MRTPRIEVEFVAKRWPAEFEEGFARPLIACPGAVSFDAKIIIVAGPEDAGQVEIMKKKLRNSGYRVVEVERAGK